MSNCVLLCVWAMHGSRGGTGGPYPPLKNHKTVGFLSNTGPDPLKITKLPSQHPMLGHLWPTFSGIWIPTRLPSLTKKDQINTSELNPLWQNFLDPPMWALIFKYCMVYFSVCIPPSLVWAFSGCLSYKYTTISWAGSFSEIINFYLHFYWSLNFMINPKQFY